MGPSDECTLGTAKRPLGDCLEGLVQMLSPLFVQRTYKAGAFLVKQVSLAIFLSLCAAVFVCLSRLSVLLQMINKLNRMRTITAPMCAYTIAHKITHM